MTDNARVLLFAPVLVLLAASCSTSRSLDDEPAGRGVSVRAVVVPEPVSFDPDGLGRTYRQYGPGVKFSRWGTIREPDLFEVRNGGPGTVAWVAWKHTYTFTVPRDVVRRDAFVSEGEPRLLLRPPFERVAREETLAYVGSLPRGARVMCCRRESLPAWNEGLLYRPEVAAGAGPEDGPRDFPRRRAGQVSAVRSGRTGAPPPDAGRLVRYAGPAGLLVRGSIEWERLESVLADFASADRAGRERLLRGMVFSCQQDRSHLPVVDHYKIVALLVRLAVEEPPRQVAADEEPPAGLDFAGFALSALLDMVPAEQLRKHAGELGALAVRAGDRRVAELLVKAGSAKALKELAASPDRLPAEGRESLLMAVRAAAGDEQAFASSIAAFAAAQDARVKVELGRLLALVGRQEGLKALAGQMRDARVYRDARGELRSVRSELADSLRLVHPTRVEFYTCILPTRKQMAGVELECLREYGVEFEGPPPPDEAEGAEAAAERSAAQED